MVFIDMFAGLSEVFVIVDKDVFVVYVVVDFLF